MAEGGARGCGGAGVGERRSRAVTHGGGTKAIREDMTVSFSEDGSSGVPAFEERGMVMCYVTRWHSAVSGKKEHVHRWQARFWHS